MSRETKYTAVILKKQPFGESDEIITFFTREQGKVRGLAKSVKLSKSKLQQKLQTLFLVNLTLSHGKLPKVISVEPLETFSGLRENLPALKRAFYIIELVLKFTPDEQKNEPLFFLLEDALKYLSISNDETVLDLALAKFKISVLETVGLGLHHDHLIGKATKLFFSASRGGFVREARGAEAMPVEDAVYSLFLELNSTAFSQLVNIYQSVNLMKLQILLANFIEYQLERQVKSQKYLQHEM